MSPARGVALFMQNRFEDIVCLASRYIFMIPFNDLVLRFGIYSYRREVAIAQLSFRSLELQSFL